MTTVSLYEETFSGERTPILTVDFLTEVVTARELIRRYVYETVRDRNLREAERIREVEDFRHTFETNEKERLLNKSPRVAAHKQTARQIDWEEQEKHALEAFRRNRFFLLVDNRQVTDVEEKITLRPETEISFLRLIPLAGG
jgi:hypothetical protein